MIVRKKYFAVLLVLLLFIVGNTVTAKADVLQAVPIQPFYANADSINARLSFNNGKGTLSGIVYGKQGTTSITGNAVLEQQNANDTYTKVASWTGLSTTGGYAVVRQNVLCFQRLYIPVDVDRYCL